MIVVSNTSPLTNLAAIGQFGLLQRLYDRLHIAKGVWKELNAAGKRWPGRDDVAGADWVERHNVQNQDLVTVLRRDLDLGEAETSLWPCSLVRIWSCWTRRKGDVQLSGLGCVSWGSWASCLRPRQRAQFVGCVRTWMPCAKKQASP